VRPAEGLTSRAAEITVVIPVWDSPYVSCLSEAVESVHRQEIPVDLIVVDNASEVALPSLPGARVLRARRRLSAGAARNFGLEQVETPFVLFLDADDRILDGTLIYLRQALGRDPALAASVTAIIEAETGRRHPNPRRFVPALARLRRSFALCEAIWNLYPAQGCTMFRTEWVRRAGGYGDSSGGEDWVLAASQAFRGGICFSDRPGRVYRFRAGSLWQLARASRAQAEAAARVRERLRSDDGVPGWARAALPLIHAVQLFAIFVLRPVYLALRRNRPTGATPRDDSDRRPPEQPDWVREVGEPEAERAAAREG
jgi:glycosyltransferase involved in cell wall biosynthesis